MDIYTSVIALFEKVGVKIILVSYTVFVGKARKTKQKTLESMEQTPIQKNGSSVV